LGYVDSEVLGRTFDFIFTSEDQRSGVPHREMTKALETGHAFDDRWHVRKDGSQIYVNGGLCLVKDEGGQALGFVKIIRDQTERKLHIEKIEELNAQLLAAQTRLEEYAANLESKVRQRTEALNERNAELQDFCYSIAHDLRAPLRSIQAMSEVVLEDYGTALDATGQGYLTRISEAGRLLDQLTVDLLDYTRFSRDEVKLTAISLEKVVDEVVENLSESIRRKGARISIERPLPSVMGQHAYVVQILSNFLSNALKFVDADRTPVIELSATSGAGRVRVNVKDNGIGIPAPYREKIFLLFERLHPKGRFEGTGVGLAIARKAAQRMGGDVGMVANEKDGSTFWLELESAE
jgi:PAS domain S-box-containing protein